MHTRVSSGHTCAATPGVDDFCSSVARAKSGCGSWLLWQVRSADTTLSVDVVYLHIHVTIFYTPTPSLATCPLVAGLPCLCCAPCVVRFCVPRSATVGACSDVKPPHCEAIALPVSMPSVRGAVWLWFAVPLLRAVDDFNLISRLNGDIRSRTLDVPSHYELELVACYKSTPSTMSIRLHPSRDVDGSSSLYNNDEDNRNPTLQVLN